jgi:hypothetical protein
MKPTMSLSAMPKNTGAPAGGSVGASAASEPDADDYKTRADMMTLIEANKIKSDKARHGKAKAMAKTHLAHMAKVSKGE